MKERTPRLDWAGLLQRTFALDCREVIILRALRRES